MNATSLQEEQEAYALKKIQKFLTEKKIPKVRLGEILLREEVDREESQQQKYQRADRFLRGDSPLTVTRLIKIAQFLEQPILSFFPPSLVTPYTLASNEKNTKTTPIKPLGEIEKQLRAMGFSEDFIKNQIRQLQLLEAYGDVHDA